MTTIVAEMKARGLEDRLGSLAQAPACESKIQPNEQAVKDEWVPRIGDGVLVLGRSGAPRDRGWITGLADGEIEVVAAWDAAKRYRVPIGRLVRCQVTPELRWVPIETPGWVK